MTTWNELAKSIHADNVKAGWWTDLKTGESILETRDRLNLCMLVVTELNEAYEAHWADSFDDKLPQYKGVGVELADAQIRILDMLGAFNDLEEGPKDFLKRPYLGVQHIESVRTAGFSFPYADIISNVCQAAEHFRKGRNYDACKELNFALNYIENLGKALGFDMGELREAKREFNRNRADHKVENRKAEGGKKF